MVPDRERLARAGVSVAELSQLVAMATGGTEVSWGRVELGDAMRPDQLGALEVRPGVRLRDVAALEESLSPGALLSVNGLPAAEVLVFGCSPREVRRAATRSSFPPGVTLEVW